MRRVGLRFSVLALAWIGASLILCGSEGAAKALAHGRGRPQADRFQIQYYGYYPTCWRRFPEGWACPIRDCEPGASILAPKASEEAPLAPPTETKPTPATPSEPSPTPAVPSAPQPMPMTPSTQPPRTPSSALPPPAPPSPTPAAPPAARPAAPAKPPTDAKPPGGE